jgi:hypothetical protein
VETLPGNSRWSPTHIRVERRSHDEPLLHYSLRHWIGDRSELRLPLPKFTATACVWSGVAGTTLPAAAADSSQAFTRWASQPPICTSNSRRPSAEAGTPESAAASPADYGRKKATPIGLVSRSCRPIGERRPNRPAPGFARRSCIRSSGPRRRDARFGRPAPARPGPWSRADRRQ